MYLCNNLASKDDLQRAHRQDRARLFQVKINLRQTKDKIETFENATNRDTCERTATI